MTQEEKDLLLKDLCSRLPYGIRCSFGVDDAVYEITGINPTCCGASEIQATHINSSVNGDFRLDSCKPYLLPLSSMTEEDVKEFYDVECMDAKVGYIKPSWNWHFTINGIDWLNAHHFDYRELIPKGLANDATGLNIY